MSRTTLKPGDLIAIDPVRPGVVAGTVLVAENGEDLYFAYTNVPWTERKDMEAQGQPGLTRAEAEEVLNGEREYPGAVLYLVWKEETQTSYGIPESVQEEIDRRQMAVEPISAEPGERFDKIPPRPLDFDTPRDGMW